MHRRDVRRRRGPRKDRLIQTRVAEELQRLLKNEAGRRRLTVSHLIRNVLEDTFELVENVVSEVDNIVAGSVDLAEQVRRDAEKIAHGARKAHRDAVREARVRREDDDGEDDREADPIEDAQAVEQVEEQARQPAKPDPTADVDAWNAVTINRPAECAKCETALERGDRAHMGISADPTAPRVWLCDDCLEQLS